MMRLKDMLRMVFSAALLFTVAVSVPCDENSTSPLGQPLADVVPGRLVRVPLHDPTSTFLQDLRGVREVRLFNFTTTCSFFV